MNQKKAGVAGQLTMKFKAKISKARNTIMGMEQL